MIRLSDVCDVRDGTHDSPRYVEYGYPLVTSKNIKDGQLDLSVVNFITEEDYNKINERSKVDVGDIIMPMIGTIGNPYLVEEVCNFAIKNVALIKCDNLKVINRFVWYFLQSNAFERYVETKNKGGTQKFLSLGDIRAIELPLVPTDGQKDIIETLSCVDSVVAKRKQQLQKLDELLKARFVEMFGDPLNSSKKWETVLVGDVCFVTKLAGFEYTNYINYKEKGDVIMVRGLNVKDGHLKLNDIYWIDEKTSNLLPRSQLRENDIVMTYVGVNIGDVALVDGKYRYHLAPNVAKISPYLDSNLNPVFFVNLLAYNKDNFAGNATNTAKQALNMDKIRKLEVMLPPIDLQDQFAGFVQQIDKSKLHVQKSLEKLEILKKSLMQKYFG